MIEILHAFSSHDSILPLSFNPLSFHNFFKPSVSYFTSSMHSLLISTANCFQDISGEELVKALQIKEKILRRKTLSALEEKVIMILSEQGYVSKDELSGAIENLADIVEEEDEDEVIEDGEVDEGDVHIKPVSRKPHRQVMVIILFSLNMCYNFFSPISSYWSELEILFVVFCGTVFSLPSISCTIDYLLLLLIYTISSV